MTERKRLWLQSEVSKTGRRLAEAELKGLHFTLIFFDLGGPGHVAFISTLSRPEMIDAWRQLLASWKAHRPRVGFAKPGQRVATAAEVHAAGEAVNAPPGVGYALLIGSGELTSYHANGDREGVTELLEMELFPNWESDEQNG